MFAGQPAARQGQIGGSPLAGDGRRAFRCVVRDAGGNPSPPVLMPCAEQPLLAKRRLEKQ